MDTIDTIDTNDTTLSTNQVFQRGSRLLRIAGRKAMYDSKDGFEERLTLIPVDDILYVFTAGALSFKPKQARIDAKWTKAKLFSPGRVYVRTPYGLFKTRYRTLKKLLAKLDPEKFFSIHKSLVVNVLKVSLIDFATNMKRVGVAVHADRLVEWLTVSDGALKHIRPALGL